MSTYDCQKPFSGLNVNVTLKMVFIEQKFTSNDEKYELFVKAIEMRSIAQVAARIKINYKMLKKNVDLKGTSYFTLKT